jgi:hypothetical protein
MDTAMVIFYNRDSSEGGITLHLSESDTNVERLEESVASNPYSQSLPTS